MGAGSQCGEPIVVRHRDVIVVDASARTSWKPGAAERHSARDISYLRLREEMDARLTEAAAYRICWAGDRRNHVGNARARISRERHRCPGGDPWSGRGETSGRRRLHSRDGKVQSVASLLGPERCALDFVEANRWNRGVPIPHHAAGRHEKVIESGRHRERKDAGHLSALVLEAVNGSLGSVHDGPLGDHLRNEGRVAGLCRIDADGEYELALMDEERLPFAAMGM